MQRAREGLRVPIRRQVGARRRAESDARFRALVQHATDVITVLDAAGTIRYTSPAVESVLGYRPEERLADSAFDLIHPDDAPGARVALAGLLGSPDAPVCLVLRLRHRDGTWRHLEVTAKNLLVDLAVRGIVVNYRDTTARSIPARRRRSPAARASSGRGSSARCWGSRWPTRRAPSSRATPPCSACSATTRPRCAGWGSAT